MLHRTLGSVNRPGRWRSAGGRRAWSDSTGRSFGSGTKTRGGARPGAEWEVIGRLPDRGLFWPGPALPSRRTGALQAGRRRAWKSGPASRTAARRPGSRSASSFRRPTARLPTGAASVSGRTIAGRLRGGASWGRGGLAKGTSGAGPPVSSQDRIHCRRPPGVSRLVRGERRKRLLRIRAPVTGSERQGRNLRTAGLDVLSRTCLDAAQFTHVRVHAWRQRRSQSISLLTMKLRGARVRPDESFSQVIKRGRWDRIRSTGAALLAALERAPVVDEGTLRRLEANQRTDLPPSEAWND